MQINPSEKTIQNNAYSNYYEQPYPSIEQKDVNKKKSSKVTTKKVVIIILIVLVALVLLAGIILIILFGTIPCSFIKCHSRASKCVNHPFRVECQCDYGYQGDGVSYCDECGVTYASKNLRIVGGVEAVPNSWPSAALVVFTFKANVYIESKGVYVSISQAYSCGGTLIDRRTVLTAAHCIQSSVDFTYDGSTYTTTVEANSYFSTIEQMYKVYLGVHNKSQRTTSPAFEASVSKAYRHESYDSNSKLNDIAILKLTDEVKLNNYVQIACLPDSTQQVYPSTYNLVSWAIGWGKLNYLDTSGSDTLRNVALTLYNSDYCANVSKTLTKNWNSQICAGKIEGGKDTCQGDSGGSLFVSDTVNGAIKLISVGVTSYGDRCAMRGYPGIYTRVSYFNSWIQTNKWYWN